MQWLVGNTVHLYEMQQVDTYVFVHSGGANSIWNNATPGVTHANVLFVWKDNVKVPKSWVTWSVGGSSITFNATAKSESGIPGEFDFGTVEVFLVKQP